MDLLDWKNTQPHHQQQKKVTYSLNFTLGNCKNPGLITVIVGYRMTPGAPERVVCQPRQQRQRENKKPVGIMSKTVRDVHHNFLIHFCDATARLRREDVNIRRQFFPLYL